MPKYRVEITRTAEDDIVSVFEYIAQNDQAAAIKWVEEVERQIDSLARIIRVLLSAKAHLLENLNFVSFQSMISGQTKLSWTLALSPHPIGSLTNLT